MKLGVLVFLGSRGLDGPLRYVEKGSRSAVLAQQ